MKESHRFFSALFAQLVAFLYQKNEEKISPNMEKVTQKTFTKKKLNCCDQATLQYMDSVDQ